MVVNGSICGFVRCLLDFIEIERRGQCSHYVWFSEGAYFTEFDEHDLKRWLEPGVSLSGCFISSIEEYVDFLRKCIGSVIRNKVLMLDFSGGKDSLVSLILLSELANFVDFELRVVYVHVPFLDSLSSVDSAVSLANRIGYNPIVVEADRSKMRFYLENKGLPRVGDRWCTYLKVASLRKVRKSIGADYEVKGDRILEGGKRYAKMLGFLNEKKFVFGKYVNVVYPLTIIDIARIIRRFNVINPQYLMGLTRVSCKYCPYKSLFELYVSRDLSVENEDYVDYILHREYQKWYSSIVSWIDFREHCLWRFTPTRSKILLKRKMKHSRSLSLRFRDIRGMITSVWREKLPTVSTYSFEDLNNKLRHILDIIEI